MLSTETETIISKLFSSLAQHEKNIEIYRLVLAENSDFEPYSLFRFLDKENKKYIDEYNIIEFLK